MADILTVTVLELPALADALVTGDEQVPVTKNGQLTRIRQGSLRGTRTYSGSTLPPIEPSVLIALAPVLGDRWRNTSTGDEWKATSLLPFVWTPDGNVNGADGVSDRPGPPGPTGGPGPRGPAGNIFSRLAGQAIPADTVVVAQSGDICVPADPTNLSHRGKVLGLVHAQTSAGAQASIQSLGDVANVLGSFSAGETLYIGLDAKLTRALPSSAVWRQAMGTATTSSRIVLNLSEARLIGNGSALFLPPSDALLQAALLRILDGRPYLPDDPADYPDAGGLFKNGDPATDGGTYTIVRIPPKV